MSFGRRRRVEDWKKNLIFYFFYFYGFKGMKMDDRWWRLRDIKGLLCCFLFFFFVETVKTHKRERERKVKKLGDDGSLLTTMDMQSDG